MAAALTSERFPLPTHAFTIFNAVVRGDVL